MHAFWFQKLWFLLFLYEHLTAEPDSPKSRVIYLIPQKVFRNPSSAIMRWLIWLIALPVQGIYFFFRFHIFLVPSHLPSLLGESHKDSGMGKQNKKDSCKNTKSAQSQHLELSVMLQGDYCSYPNWEKTEDRTGRGSYPVLMSRGSSSLTVPHCFAP